MMEVRHYKSILLLYHILYILYLGTKFAGIKLYRGDLPRTEFLGSQLAHG